MPTLFRVEDMTCGHCASTITKAVKAADRDAHVAIELDDRLVRIEGGTADEAELAEAIFEAGYTPVAVVAEPAVDTPAKAGSCCGGCGGR